MLHMNTKLFDLQDSRALLEVNVSAKINMAACCVIDNLLRGMCDDRILLSGIFSSEVLTFAVLEAEDIKSLATKGIQRTLIRFPMFETLCINVVVVGMVSTIAVNKPPVTRLAEPRRSFRFRI